MTYIPTDRLLKTIRRQAVESTPIWIMRQAGRYLPEYRAIRAQAGSFMNLCQTPELACAVTLQPLKRYHLDAAIIFSDILTIPDALGMELTFVENKGPMFGRPLSSADDIDRLQPCAMEKLNYVYDSIRLVKKELQGRIPLIGFCGSPWTMAAYMLEGKSTECFLKIWEMLEKDPAVVHKLLNLLSICCAKHLHEQINAGADLVMIFDTWGGLFNSSIDYSCLSLDYVKQIIHALKHTYKHEDIPIVLFTKGGTRWLKDMAESACDVIGVDWGISLREAREQVGTQVTLQGNLHPDFLKKSEVIIRQEVARVLKEYGYGPGHIFNLGHGITPDVPPENVTVLIEAVRELSKAYHTG